MPARRFWTGLALLDAVAAVAAAVVGIWHATTAWLVLAGALLASAALAVTFGVRWRKAGAVGDPFRGP